MPLERSKRKTDLGDVQDTWLENRRYTERHPKIARFDLFRPNEGPTFDASLVSGRRWTYIWNEKGKSKKTWMLDESDEWTVSGNAAKEDPWIGKTVLEIVYISEDGGGEEGEEYENVNGSEDENMEEGVSISDADDFMPDALPDSDGSNSRFQDRMQRRIFRIVMQGGEYILREINR
eukprot:TRINITY_DN49322_c0_g1_i1.p2 TRINITY_DN49322_c0_g1~~TRINITY_DN49322_c0_g1_i1.p2  ORF type:complete len:177 (-),score=31.33 TRINITY_DN49322_c0_g1_i1:1105-1635(-)